MTRSCFFFRARGASFHVARKASSSLPLMRSSVLMLCSLAQLSSCLAKIVVSLATVEGLRFSCFLAERNLETASPNDVANSLFGSAPARFLCSASSKSRSTARRVSSARSQARVFALLWERFPLLFMYNHLGQLQRFEY